MSSTEPSARSRLAKHVALTLYGNKAHGIVEKQINALAEFKLNKGDIDLGIKERPAYEVPNAKMPHLAIALFQCDSKIAKKIEHLKNENNEPIVSRKAGHHNGHDVTAVSIWNAETKSFDEYVELHAQRDPKSGFQGAALYDPKTNSIMMSFGGTDFTNPRDMFRSGGQMLGGIVDDRMTRAIPFTEIAMDRFKEISPEKFDSVTIDLAGHSVARGLPLVEYCLNARYGKASRSKTIIEPMGAKSAYDLVAGMVAKAENKSEAVTFDELTHNATTYRARQGSFIDWFPQVSENIGDIVLKSVKGKGPIAPHMGAPWIEKLYEESAIVIVKRFDESNNRNPSFKQEATI